MNSTFESFNKVSSSVSELMPKLIKDTIPEVLGEKVTKAVSDSVPSFSDVVAGKYSQNTNKEIGYYRFK